jgi:hypothetical protein
MAEESKTTKLCQDYANIWLNVKDSKLDMDGQVIDAAVSVAELAAQLESEFKKGNNSDIATVTAYYNIIDEAHYLRNLSHITKPKEIPHL